MPEGTPAPAAPVEGAPAAPATPPAPPAAAPTPPAPEPTPGDGLPDDPAALKAMIAGLRKENASDRTNAKQTAADEARNTLAQEIGKALGLVKDGEAAPDAAALTAQALEAQTAAKQAQLELAVYRTAGVKNADPAALLDSRAFLTAVAAIDPTDTAALTAAIDKAITDNPKFKAVQVAGSSSVNHAGGSGEGTGKTPLSLDAAVEAALTS